MKRLTVFFSVLLILLSLYSFNAFALEIPDKSDAKQVSITVSSDNTSHGVVIGQGKYVADKPIRVEAIALEGYVFEGWYQKDKLVSEDAVFNFVTEDNISLVAKFVPDKQKVEGSFWTNTVNFLFEHLFVTILVFIILFALLSLPFITSRMRKAAAEKAAKEKIIVMEMHSKIPPGSFGAAPPPESPETSVSASPVPSDSVKFSRPSDKDLM